MSVSHAGLGWDDLGADDTRADKMLPRVFLLKAGSIQRDQGGNILDARSSVTLIESDRGRIVVDTGQEGDGKEILNALKRLGLEQSDIDFIINTHSHPDHCANNHLFRRAEIIFPADGEMIAAGVRALATPGHSKDSISLVVDAAAHLPEEDRIAPASGIVVIAGDALPTWGNFQKRVPPALHYDRALAVASMNRIIEIADMVIPGHDRPFSVREGRMEKFIGLWDE